MAYDDKDILVNLVLNDRRIRDYSRHEPDRQGWWCDDVIDRTTSTMYVHVYRVIIYLNTIYVYEAVTGMFHNPCVGDP